MNRDPNIARVESVADALGELRDDVVFVGGCAAGLLINATTAAPPRVTYDVDVIVEVASIVDYYAIERRLEKHGFRRDSSEGAPICRWRLRDLEVDVMPTDARVFSRTRRSTGERIW